MKHFSHLNTATGIINKYSGNQPFHLFIKDFFRQNKKYGSKDRKQITHLCYCYFRLGQAANNKSVQQAITEALFLCSEKPGDLLSALAPSWNEKATASIDEKYAMLGTNADSFVIFPFPEALSNGIDPVILNRSHLIQPDVFIRIRPGHQQSVISKLQRAAVSFTLTEPGCISLPATTRIEDLLDINKEAVIQDYNSQHTGNMLQLVPADSAGCKVWDCCAASGGKSIMATDILGDIELTVSDIRPSVLQNLRKRFTEAGIKNYKVLPADLTKPATNLPSNNYDLVIADVPCTGSGTWGRTPERLSFFNKKEIDQYSQLQQKIVLSALPGLKKGGYFLYITCSVFKKENEEMIDFILKNTDAALIKMELLKGYTMKADTMFAALLKRSK